MDTRTVFKQIWASNDYEIRIVMKEQEQFKEQYPGGPKYWYNIPGTAQFAVETDTIQKVFDNAMEAFQHAAKLERS